ncbi:DNA helicase rad5 [Savitreella phatthalungensis]
MNSAEKHTLADESPQSILTNGSTPLIKRQCTELPSGAEAGSAYQPSSDVLEPATPSSTSRQPTFSSLRAPASRDQPLEIDDGPPSPLPVSRTAGRKDSARHEPALSKTTRHTHVIDLTASDEETPVRKPSRPTPASKRIKHQPIRLAAGGSETSDAEADDVSIQGKAISVSSADSQPETTRPRSGLAPAEIESASRTLANRLVNRMTVLVRGMMGSEGSPLRAELKKRVIEASTFIKQQLGFLDHRAGLFKGFKLLLNAGIQPKQLDFVESASALFFEAMSTLSRHKFASIELPPHEELALEFIGLNCRKLDGIELNATHPLDRPDTDAEDGYFMFWDFCRSLKLADVHNYVCSLDLRDRRIFCQFVATGNHVDAVRCLWDRQKTKLRDRLVNQVISDVAAHIRRVLTPSVDYLAAALAANDPARLAAATDQQASMARHVADRVNSLEAYRRVLTYADALKVAQAPIEAKHALLSVLCNRRIAQDNRGRMFEGDNLDAQLFPSGYHPVARAPQLDKDELDHLIDDIANAGHEEPTEDTIEQAARELGARRVPGVLRRYALDDLRCTLMPHQVVGVEWMIRREAEQNEKGRENKTRGGLLADDMGLGKTVQCISLMVKNLPDPQASVSSSRQATLIICPVALLDQWAKEIKTKARRDAFRRIHIYHGTDKVKGLQQLKSFDVVITSYGIMAREYPSTKGRGRMTEDEKEEWEEFCERKKGILFRVNWYRVILDEAHIIKNPIANVSVAAAKLKYDRIWCLSGTPLQNSVNDIYPIFRMLKVSGLSDFSQFSREIGKHARSAHKLHHALSPYMIRRRKDDDIAGLPILQLPEKHVELIELEQTEREKDLYAAVEARARATINELLDGEETATKTFSSVFELLIRLRQVSIHPILAAELVIKGTNVDRENLSYAQVEELSALAIAGGVEGSGTLICGACGAEAESPIFATSCHHVFCTECVEDLLEEPDAICRGCNAPMGRLEKYDPRKHVVRPLLAEAKVEASEANSAAMTRNSTIATTNPSNVTTPRFGYTSDDEFDDVFPSIPNLIKRRSADGQSDSGRSETKSHESKGAIDEFFQSDRHRAHTHTRQGGNSNAVRDISSIGRRLNDKEKWWGKLLATDWPTSTKISKCRQDIQKVIDETDDKILVFCTFVRALDVLACELHAHRIPFSRYHGDLRVPEREAVLSSFTTKTEPHSGASQHRSSPRVLLISLKAGGVGLNLTAANHVIMMDFWWNAAAEHQAIDRAHRIGQEKSVFVSRIALANTIEQRILALQEQKLAVAGEVLGEVLEGEDDEEDSVPGGSSRKKSGKTGKNRARKNKKIQSLSLNELLSLFGRVERDADGRRHLVAHDRP